VAAAAPYAIGIGGPSYLAVSPVLGIVFVVLAVRVYRIREGRAADAVAKRLFLFSIFYLLVLFAALLADHNGDRRASIWSAHTSTTSVQADEV